MSELSFDVVDVTPARYAAAPGLTARLRIEESTDVRIHAIALRCQVRIDAQRRGYRADEAAGLVDQFGATDRWGTTLKPFVWMHCSAMVQGFSGSTEVELPMPVTYDFEVTASKYLHALQDGNVPLTFLFSGTVFTRGQQGFGVEQLSWSLESAYRMPVEVWRSAMREFYPGSGWLRLHHDTLVELAGYKAAQGLTTWDTVVESLLAAKRDVVP